MEVSVSEGVYAGGGEGEVYDCDNCDDDCYCIRKMWRFTLYRSSRTRQGYLSRRSPLVKDRSCVVRSTSIIRKEGDGLNQYCRPLIPVHRFFFYHLIRRRRWGRWLVTMVTVERGARAGAGRSYSNQPRHLKANMASSCRKRRVPLASPSRPLPASQYATLH